MAATIRHATRQDVPTILALIRELAIYENAESSAQATEDLLLKNLSFEGPSSTSDSSFTPGYAKTLLIVDPDGEVCGMGLYFYNFSTWTGTPGIYLEDLFVKPSYRGRGYGKALIKALAQEVIRIGGSRLSWVCLNWNKPSLEFYANLGATRMNEWVGLRLENEALVKVAEN